MQIIKKHYSKVILILFLIVVLFIKNEYTYLLLNNANYGMPALIKKGEVEDLYIGSSIFRQGLDIKTLEEKSEDTVILSYNGNQPALEYLELKHLLDNGVKIKNLYLDIYAYGLCADPKISDVKYLLEINLKDKLEVFKLISNKNKFALFWEMFVSSNNEVLLIWPLNYYLVNDMFYKGGSTSKTGHTSIEAWEKTEIPSISNTFNDTQFECLNNIIDLCNENNINLVFIDIPKSAKADSNSDYAEMLNKYKQYLKERNIEYIDYSSLTEGSTDLLFDANDPENYTDLFHMSSTGRERFTKMLIN